MHYSICVAWHRHRHIMCHMIEFETPGIPQQGSLTKHRTQSGFCNYTLHNPCFLTPSFSGVIFVCSHHTDLDLLVAGTLSQRPVHPSWTMIWDLYLLEKWLILLYSPLTHGMTSQQKDPHLLRQPLLVVYKPTPESPLLLRIEKDPPFSNHTKYNPKYLYMILLL